MGSPGGGGGGGASATATISKTVSGRFGLAISTSFQPAEWDYTLFQSFPGLTAPLGNLQPQHIRLQGISQGIPQTSSSTWDFTILDAITQPVLTVADRSPEFQIAKAPPFMYTAGDSGNSFLDLTFAPLAGYTQNLVEYYNVPGGFPAPDGQHASPSGIPITWWGIYNEPNINNNLTNNYASSTTRSKDQDSFDVKVDHQQSDNDRFSARYSFQRPVVTDPGRFGIAGGGGKGFAATGINRTQSTAVARSDSVTPSRSGAASRKSSSGTTRRARRT